MTQPNEVNEETIRQLLAAFEVAMADCNAADSAVDAVSTSTPWHGDAAVLYMQELQNWRGGLAQVRNGLELLRASMTQHLQISSNAELESSANARWYQG